MLIPNMDVSGRSFLGQKHAFLAPVLARERREANTNGNRQAFVKLNIDFQREARKDEAR